MFQVPGSWFVVRGGILEPQNQEPWNLEPGTTNYHSVNTDVQKRIRYLEDPGD